MYEEVIGSRRIHEGYIINLRQDTVKLPDGRVSTRDVVEHPGAVSIVPVLPDGRIAFVRQFRLPAGKDLLEIPAGTLHADENPDDCAARELVEETNYKAGKLQKILFAYLAPGYSSEGMHFYLAEDLAPCQGEADDDEFLDVELYTWEEALQLIHSGEIGDAKSVTGLLVAARILGW